LRFLNAGQFLGNAYTCMHAPKIGNLTLSDVESLYMGAIWLVSTILFEFIAGHYVFGNPWERLVTDYNLLQGRVWSLVPLVILVAPYIMNRLGKFQACMHRVEYREYKRE
jgi:hypothetical protein